jgi:hypothetical protein
MARTLIPYLNLRHHKHRGREYEVVKLVGIETRMETGACMETKEKSADDEAEAEDAVEEKSAEVGSGFEKEKKTSPATNSSVPSSRPLIT